MGLRQQRIADEIRDIIAGMLLGGIMADPRLESVTITAVKVTQDISYATVYYRVYEDGNKPAAQKGLDSAAGFFRKRLSITLDIRRAPELKFVYDVSIENAARIETLLIESKDGDEEA